MMKVQHSFVNKTDIHGDETLPKDEALQLAISEAFTVVETAQKSMGADPKQCVFDVQVIFNGPEIRIDIPLEEKSA